MAARTAKGPAGPVRPWPETPSNCDELAELLWMRGMMLLMVEGCHWPAWAMICSRISAEPLYMWGCELLHGG